MNPIPVTKLDLAFPARVSHLLPTSEPDWEKYRKAYDRNETWGFKLFHDWFYTGLTSLEVVPMEGIDANAALAHIRCIMGSFEPKHEDKTCGVAYLLEHWFSSATWTLKGQPPKTHTE